MSIRQVYRLVDGVASRLLPPRCVLCHGPGQLAGYDLCADCESRLPVPPAGCPRCGLPGPGAGHVPCARCVAEPPPFARLCAPWLYEDPVTRLVQALKYDGALANARVLGTRIARDRATDLLPAGESSLLVPVPLHPARLVERGFNQSHEIARVVARALGLRLAPAALRRVRATPAQVGLARAERLGNLRDAFRADAGVVSKQAVILLDDVVTTGSTVAAAATELLRAGAASVEVWAAARALA
jgi:ComF family protein